jgi:uncharacterized protein YbjT (DUF2867 family)
MKTSHEVTSDIPAKDTLIIGGTGKTGRRVAEKLKARGVRVRLGSRSATPSFDWENEATWHPALQGVDAVYLTYYPDLAIPGAVRAVRSLVEAAKQQNVRHIVLLSGRGEEEAQQAERVVQDSGLDWTIVRASWFAQNFSESYLLDAVLSGEVVLPAGNVPEPFVDADDIADVAVAALTDSQHLGQIYEVTGARSLTFADAVREIATALGRDIRYVQVSPEEFTQSLTQQNVPKDIVWLLNYLFTTVLDGRNEHPTDGVQRALGRPPLDFADYVRKTVAEGSWSTPASAQRKS